MSCLCKRPTVKCHEILDSRGNTESTWSCWWGWKRKQGEWVKLRQANDNCISFQTQRWQKTSALLDGASPTSPAPDQSLKQKPSTETASAFPLSSCLCLGRIMTTALEQLWFLVIPGKETFQAQTRHQESRAERPASDGSSELSWDTHRTSGTELWQELQPTQTLCWGDKGTWPPPASLQDPEPRWTQHPKHQGTAQSTPCPSPRTALAQPWHLLALPTAAQTHTALSKPGQMQHTKGIQLIKCWAGAHRSTMENSTQILWIQLGDLIGCISSNTS